MKQSLPKRLGNLYESCISYFWTIDPFFVHIAPHLRGAMTSIDIWGDRYCNVHVCACFVSCVFFWPLVSIFSSYIIFYKEDMYLIEKALPHCQNLHYTKFAIHIVRKFMPLLTIAFFSLVLFNKHAITCNFHVIHNQLYLQCKELPSKLQRYWLSFYFWPFFQVLFFSSSLVLDKSSVPNIS